MRNRCHVRRCLSCHLRVLILGDPRYRNISLSSVLSNRRTMQALMAVAAIPSFGHLRWPAKETCLTMKSRSSRSVACVNSQRRPRYGLQVLLCQRQTNHRTNGDEDDDVFDDLLNKYGKVVYKRGDQMSPSGEADDDAESLSFAVTLAKVANDVKAADIRILFVKPLVYWTRFFIIVTAFSRPQIDAIGSRIRDIAEKQFRKIASGDTKPNSWTLMDFGDVVVHIFLPQQRAFYNLEEFYANATPIELPFDTPPSVRK
ncbi:protein Iojap, chloroplastic [Dendrobium catenatum]|uniref:Protein Iojap, chloroplastic n=1 Tax=Dendrobium catenatum TaxID=906689 RepID=A0A2I0WFH1_9ASPA|nr:protein Iojap, chloroplastic [Dendrobium catenatum]PKU74421.1 Protein Iojap, chloroplastic [Dendrobium catenatum]